jgi:hypothetical protein
MNQLQPCSFAVVKLLPAGSNRILQLHWKEAASNKGAVPKKRY